MTHTPGPWETSSNEHGQWDVCAEGGGDMIADLAHCDNSEANAHLIAAAPALLEACKAIADHYDEDDLLAGDLRKVLAAIALAEKGS